MCYSSLKELFLGYPEYLRHQRFDQNQNIIIVTDPWPKKCLMDSSKEQGAGSREQGAGSREQGVGSRDVCESWEISG